MNWPARHDLNSVVLHNIYCHILQKKKKENEKKKKKQKKKHDIYNMYTTRIWLLAWSLCITFPDLYDNGQCRWMVDNWKYIPENVLRERERERERERGGEGGIDLQLCDWNTLLSSSLPSTQCSGDINYCNNTVFFMLIYLGRRQWLILVSVHKLVRWKQSGSCATV